MSKSSSRAGRIADQIQRDVAQLIQTEIKDPRVGIVTVTGVELSPDYRHAKVFFTALGAPSTLAGVLEGLQHAAGFLRSRLAASLRLRVAPDLHFEYDESVERGDRLSRLIDEATGKRSRRSGESS